MIYNQNFCVTFCLFPDLDQREATKLMHTGTHKTRLKHIEIEREEEEPKEDQEKR